MSTGARYSSSAVGAIVLAPAVTLITKLAEDAQATTNPPPRGTVPAHTVVAAATTSPVMELYKFLITDLDAEGRYLVLNAMANQLRYPNAHTLFFSRAILQLFLDAPGVAKQGQEVVREHITRILLERLIVHRPHPWGLLVTFGTLIRNPVYSFWSHPFTRLNPDIERVIESVAKSCTPAAQSDQLLQQ